MHSFRRHAALSPLGSFIARPAGLLALMLALLGSSAAWAQLYDTPYADASYTHNSNIFALPFNGITTNMLTERAGVNALYDWSRQEFYATIEGRHYGYSGLGELDHSEYLIHGGLQWTLTSLFDGVVDYRRERSMVNFIEFQGANAAAPAAESTQLFLQSDEVATASANVNITPDWRWLNEGQIHNMNSPRPGYPDLSLTEHSIREGIRYNGISKLSAGFDAIYLTGHFDNDEFVGSPRYNEKTIEAAAHYKATGLSSFDGTAGYTKRDQGVGGSVGGSTGSLTYTRAITGKTSLNFKVYRTVNSYVTYGGAELDTGYNVGALWNATERISVTPGYAWLYANFPGTIAGIGERGDHYQLATLQVRYQIRDWISIRPYGQYEARKSSLQTVTFNRSMYGVELEVRLGHDTNKNYQLNLPLDYTVQ